MPMMRPKPRQVSQAPTGELNENSDGTGSRYEISQSAQCRSVEYFHLSTDCGGSASSTTCSDTRPRPTRSAVSSDSITRARSALPRRNRSCTTSSVSPTRSCTRVYPCDSSSLRISASLKFLGTETGKQMYSTRIASRRRARHRILVDALRGVPAHRLAAVPAMQLRRAREQQLQMIVELGHRADGRARRAHRVRLVDRDGRRNAVDAVHRRLVHAVEELARVRRERLDVTTLALGVQRVEHQRGLARAGHTRHDHELVQRNLEAQVLEVVLPGTVDADAGV